MGDLEQRPVAGIGAEGLSAALREVPGSAHGALGCAEVCPEPDALGCRAEGMEHDRFECPAQDAPEYQSEYFPVLRALECRAEEFPEPVALGCRGNDATDGMEGIGVIGDGGCVPVSGPGADEDVCAGTGAVDDGGAGGAWDIDGAAVLVAVLVGVISGASFAAFMLVGLGLLGMG